MTESERRGLKLILAELTKNLPPLVPPYEAGTQNAKDVVAAKRWVRRVLGGVE